MELYIERGPSTPKSTIGKFYVNGIYECFTMEDPIRERKIATKTCIPAGRFRVKRTMSKRFKRMLPLIFNRDDFSVVAPNGDRWEGVRIHPGNDADDTDGCILPGRIRMNADCIANSRSAFDTIDARIMMAEKNGEEVWLTIENPKGISVA